MRAPGRLFDMCKMPVSGTRKRFNQRSGSATSLELVVHLRFRSTRHGNAGRREEAPIRSNHARRKHDIEESCQERKATP